MEKSVINDRQVEEFVFASLWKDHFIPFAPRAATLTTHKIIVQISHFNT